jgi:hypothetical protein
MLGYLISPAFLLGTRERTFHSLLGEKDTKVTSSSRFPQNRELGIEILLTEAVYVLRRFG